MIIGLLRGEGGVEDEEKIDEVQRAVQDLIESFKKNNGSIKCKELLGCDISTKLGMTEVTVKGLFSKRCPRYVEDAAMFIETMLEEG